MEDVIKRLIEYESESFKLDYKTEQYQLGKHPKKGELLKDIIAFANHLSDDDKYIIIGVKDGVEKTILEVDNPIDDAKYQEFIREYIEPAINFEYRSIKYGDKLIAYFRIYDNADKPYLFKKDFKVENNAQQFKRGGGYVRTGSSTTKIGRKEIDDIYNYKYHSKDRKSDIVVVPTIRETTDEYLSGYKCIDLDIINNSNKSICCDVEMRVYKNKDCELLSKVDLKRYLKTKERKNSSSLFTPYSIGFETMDADIFNVSYKNLEFEVFVKLKKRKNEASAIRIAQNSIKKDVFYQHLIYIPINSEPCKVDATITVRSDDFIKGSLIQNISFELT